MRIFTLMCLVALTFRTEANAQIVLDGSVGPAGGLNGPDYAVGADLGTTIGTNLFHSFSAFNILTGESATFSGPDAIDNIISRVTGGTLSTIDGLLRSTIPSADFYLVNPSGILFGENARLDVDGSFHASTADHLRFSDDAKFSANDLQGSTLTVAPVEAFGFTGANPASISVNGSVLEVSDAQEISLIGGELSINGNPNGFIKAPGGQINLVSVASQGEVILGQREVDVTSVSLGNITLIDGGFSKAVLVRQATINASGDSGGSVVIRGGQLMIDGGSIFADTLADGEAGSVNIEASLVTITNGGFITSETLGSGDAGSVVVNADRFVVNERGFLSVGSFASGTGGSIEVNVGQLDLDTGGALASQTGFVSGNLDLPAGTGDAGSVTVIADTITMRNSSLISSQTLGIGAGGSSDITATESIFLDDSGIFSDTFGAGDGGNITISAPSLILQQGSNITARSTGLSTNTGDAGTVTLEVGKLLMSDQSEIATTTSTAGKAGDLTITAIDSMLLDDSKISSDTFRAGSAGSVTVEAMQLDLTAGSIITSQARPGSTGLAGNIFIISGDRVRLIDSSVTTEALSSDGGDINFDIVTLLQLDNGQITTSVGSGAGNGGNITIDPTFVALLSSTVRANAFGGDGGNITIVANNFFATPDSVIEASSNLGIEGTIEIDAPDTNVSGGLIVLSASFLDASALLTDRCATRSGLATSSLTAVGRGGLPLAPEGPLPSFYLAGLGTVDDQAAALPTSGLAGPNADVAATGQPEPTINQRELASLEDALEPADLRTLAVKCRQMFRVRRNSNVN